jgi:hypothetical protein
VVRRNIHFGAMMGGNSGLRGFVGDMKHGEVEKSSSFAQDDTRFEEVSEQVRAGLPETFHPCTAGIFELIKGSLVHRVWPRGAI